MDRQTYYNLGFLTSLLAMTGLLFVQHAELRQLKAGVATSGTPAPAPRTGKPQTPTLNRPAAGDTSPNTTTTETGKTGGDPPGREQQLASLPQQVALLQEQVAPSTETRQIMRDDSRTLAQG